MKIVQTKISPKNYNKISLESLVIGEVLVVNIFIKRNKDYVIIIEAGTLLTQQLYEKLQKQENLYLQQKDLHKQKLSAESLFNHIYHNKNDLQKSLELLYTINNKTFEDFLEAQNNLIDLNAIEKIVKSIILLIESNESFLKNIIPSFVDSKEIAIHSLHVAIYSLELAHSLLFSQEELLKVGIAAMLHDIGHKKIDTTIIEKSSTLNVLELEEIRMHSKYSLQLTKANKINDPYILDAIAHHHEYQDGTGYPDNLVNIQISKSASILCICDVFDALTNNRAHRVKKSSFDALKMMMKDKEMIYKFNQKYVKIFLKSFL